MFNLCVKGIAIALVLLVSGLDASFAFAGVGPTPTEIATPEATETATPEPTETATPEATETATPEATEIATPEAIETATPEPTETATPEPTETATPEATETATPEPTETATPEPTETATPEPTETATPEPTETATPEATETATPEATETATPEPTETATPEGTPTVTTTPSPTATATATPGQLDHFLCYETHRRPLNRKGVSAIDDLGPSTITVRQGKRLCAPVNKNNEDPTAPTHPGHLTFYTIKQTSPHFTRVKDLTITDQFGTITVDLVRAERLLVPTSKTLAAPPPPPLGPIVDHFKCYRVRGARVRIPHVSVQTQFNLAQPIDVSIKRPRDLCLPVDKNGEGILDPTRGLMCYQVRTLPQNPPHVFTTDQFGSADYNLFGIRDLCVPLTKGPGICGDGTLNAPGEECETGKGNDTACPGLCDPSTCTCSTPPRCGDNVINQKGEECDGTADGPTCSPDACDAECRCPCVPRTCPVNGCGAFPDGCGNTLECSCQSPMTCQDNVCVPPPQCLPVDAPCTRPAITIDAALDPSQCCPPLGCCTARGGPPVGVCCELD